MRASSAESVAERILSQPSSSRLQGPTVSPVFCKIDGKVKADYYATMICVPKKLLYKSVQQLRAIGGSGILVSPLTYIFLKKLQDGVNFFPIWGFNVICIIPLLLAHFVKAVG